MSEEKINKAVLDAASNVACETDEVSKHTLEEIKKQLLGISNKSDKSFIYELVKNASGEDKNGRKGK